MSAPPAHAVKALKEGGGQSVWLIRRPQQEMRTLKTWTLTPLMIVKLACGIAQPQRQLAGARRLAAAGIRTAPVLRGWGFGWRRRPVVRLELAFVAGRSALEIVRDETLEDGPRRAVSAALGAVVADLVSARLFNRDFKLANLIVDDAGEVWLIDTVGVRTARNPGIETARMLERLSVQIAPNEGWTRPATWVPAMRRALRPLPARARREAVRWLKAHRRP